MRRIALLLALAAATPAAANLTAAELAEVGVAPPPRATLPHLPFLDQDGRRTLLAPATVPTILLFADYTCRHLCGPGVTLTAGALHDAGLRPGRDYALVVVGMDQDGPRAATAFADADLKALPEVRAAIRLLSGTPAAVAAAEQALGYHATYDAAADQFAHDAASFVFTPDGRLARVLPETAATPAMLRGAIAAAARGEAAVPAGGALQAIVSVCYGFAAAHGVHGAAIVALLRAFGLLTLGAIGWGIWRLSRRIGRAA